ncbi:hypothetical protein BaRGS_00003746, partial [Batillaria attramentaria]
ESHPNTFSSAWIPVLGGDWQSMGSAVCTGVVTEVMVTSTSPTPTLSQGEKRQSPSR